MEVIDSLAVSFTFARQKPGKKNAVTRLVGLSTPGS
jgi:hypothetical protein